MKVTFDSYNSWTSHYLRNTSFSALSLHGHTSQASLKCSTFLNCMMSLSLHPESACLLIGFSNQNDSFHALQLLLSFKIYLKSLLLVLSSKASTWFYNIYLSIAHINCLHGYFLTSIPERWGEDLLFILAPQRTFYIRYSKLNATVEKSTNTGS